MRCWAVPAGLATATAVCAGLEAWLLDRFVERPAAGGGSITTLLPGFVYASATVMKLGMVAAAAGFVLASRPAAGRPVCGLAALAALPLALLLGAAAVLIGQRCLSLPETARLAVFVMMTALLSGALLAVASWLRGERPARWAYLGLLATFALVALFRLNRFYARGFDQDRWAP